MILSNLYGEEAMSIITSSPRASATCRFATRSPSRLALQSGISSNIIESFLPEGIRFATRSPRRSGCGGGGRPARRRSRQYPAPCSQGRPRGLSGAAARAAARRAAVTSVRVRQPEAPFAGPKLRRVAGSRAARGASEGGGRGGWPTWPVRSPT